MSAVHDQIENNFKYHPPKKDQQIRYEGLRTEAKVLAGIIADLCPDSRERSLALTRAGNSPKW